jgi:GST-like protein
MITFYHNGGPNPMKVALYLEEAGLAYWPVAVDTRNGDQFKPELLALNPDGKVPVIYDNDAQTSIFDSNCDPALFGGEKSSCRLRPTTPVCVEKCCLGGYCRERGRTFLRTGREFPALRGPTRPLLVEPLRLRGGRHWKIVTRLARRPYLLGATYSIADMSVRGWARLIPQMFDDSQH